MKHKILPTVHYIPSIIASSGAFKTGGKVVRLPIAHTPRNSNTLNTAPIPYSAPKNT